MKLQLPPKRFWRNAMLPATVFITGACVLVIEVVAVRILSPYFGNTIFSYSSIIGVILAALSIGYYLGGRLSDSQPSAKLFFGIIAAGGLSVAVLYFLSSAVLPVLGKWLSLTSGPLVSSLVLFLVPACLLGMLSPFAIKLQERWVTGKGIGTIAGEMFFWSTMGSIAGSLGTGFVLIPWFGVNAIVIGVSIVLIALGVVPLFFLGFRPWETLRATLLFSLLLSVPIAVMTTAAPATGDHILYQKDGIYEKVTIFDGQHNGRPTRFFKQDRSNGGAMYLDTTTANDLAYDYTKYYALYGLTNRTVQEALVLGGGAYSIPKALLNDLPQATVTVSEIEPVLLKLAKQYFRLPDTPRLVNNTEDGRRLLAHSSKKYDYIYSDVYRSLYSIPTHFTTREFFKLAHDRLNDDGVFIANIIGSTDSSQPSFTLAEMKTFQLEFPNSYFFATRSPESTDAQNIIFVGIKNNGRLDLLSDHITKSNNPIVAELASKEIHPASFNLAAYPTLTDDYAPVEYLISPLLPSANTKHTFISDGERMMASIRKQVSFGARYPSAPGHVAVQDYIAGQLQALSANPSPQSWRESDPATGKNHNLTNIIARINPQATRRILLGAHYDTKYTAERDPRDPQAAVPGANDAASGVAVLLEAARQLAHDSTLPVGVDLVFFDGEEGYERTHMAANDWKPLGSSYFAANLRQTYPQQLPETGVVVDMVCKKGLSLGREKGALTAAPKQSAAFWETGTATAPDIFSDSINPALRDDHTPLIAAGVPSFAVADLRYPEWHTQADTPDKCSAYSLAAVADTVVGFVRER